MSHISSGNKLCDASDRQTDVCSYLVTSCIIIYNEQYVVHSLVSFYPLKYYNTFSKASTTYISWRCVLTNRMEEKKCILGLLLDSSYCIHASSSDIDLLFHQYSTTHCTTVLWETNGTRHSKKRKIRFERHHSGREILAFFPLIFETQCPEMISNKIARAINETFTGSICML